jgi:hypothetical protein
MSSRLTRRNGRPRKDEQQWEPETTTWVQDVLVPVTTRYMGNCHWNRATEQTVQAVGFLITRLRQVQGGLQPVILLQATRPEESLNT